MAEKRLLCSVKLVQLSFVLPGIWFTNSDSLKKAVNFYDNLLKIQEGIQNV
jgi:hypothetical protein